MSRDLLLHCMERLQHNPPALQIHLPLAQSQRRALERLWSRERFITQMNSIVLLGPDHPDYGLGHLYYYKLIWSPHPHHEGLHALRIERRPDGTHCSPRELIIFSSVARGLVPFPYTNSVFNAAKCRLLGRESSRMSGAAYPNLRPAIANVQLLCQDGGKVLSSTPMSELVSEEYA